MKKNVPALRLVTVADTTPAAPELSPELAAMLGDIAGAAREGLLAMSVATGMAVMQAMFEAEITEAVGPKGRHDPERSAVRHGRERGSVELGGRRVEVTRPRARTTADTEVPLTSYQAFAAEDQHSGGDGQDAGRGWRPAARPAPWSRSGRRWRPRRSPRRARRCPAGS